MNRNLFAGCVAATIALAACSKDTVAPASDLAVTMASAFSAAPAGFSELSSSYSTTGLEGPFMPEFEHGHGRGGHGGPGFGGPGFGLGFMGGGLDGPFLGDGLRPFHANSSHCAFAAATGITCTDTTHNGLIVTRVSKYTASDGTVQQRIDSTTNSVTTTSSVSGTETRRDGDQSVVTEASTQTVTGLAKGSTKRTVDGASKGTESTTGTSPEGAFTSMRVTGDTITGVVIAAPTSDKPWPYPTAGRVARGMTATVTISGQAATTKSREEVITYDGSATAKVVITQDGTTQNCTLPLPHGHLTCS
jgi:hypothetical protein